MILTKSTHCTVNSTSYVETLCYCLFNACCLLWLQDLYDVMLEATFPTTAIVQLLDDDVRINKSTMSALISGQAHCEATVRGKWQLIAGSTAEGLALVQGWGHERSDVDGMFLYGSQLSVCVIQERLPKSQHLSSNSLPSSSSSLSSSAGYYSESCLMYDPEGCPPAYTRLRVTDRQTLMDHPHVDASCMLECDGHHWLLTTPLNEFIQQDLNQLETDPGLQSTSISGPAGQAQGGFLDVVPALVANEPHPSIKQYINRLHNTKWPSQDQQQLIQQLPVNLVLVGHKESPRKDQEFRLSWSSGEIILISTLPIHIKQGYIAFKYVMKHFLKINRRQNMIDDGRSKIGSYYFKSTFLYHLEETSPSKINSPFNLMMDLLRNFLGFLRNGKLPHYFLPECDLLATVGHNERQIALKSINDILSDPISAVLKCPSVPIEIYGNILPDELVAAFHQISTHPCCERSREVLLLLLSRLDEWRQQPYRRLLKLDQREDYRMSGRPELRGLVRDILEQIKHIQ